MSYSAKQRKVKTSVEGADALVRAIKAMGDAAEKVMMRGAEAGGKIALDDARKHCPEDTGALKASLKLTNGKAANPFLRNAVDNNQEQINEAIASEIARAVGAKI